MTSTSAETTMAIFLNFVAFGYSLDICYCGFSRYMQLLREQWRKMTRMHMKSFFWFPLRICALLERVSVKFLVTVCFGAAAAA